MAAAEVSLPLVGSSKVVVDLRARRRALLRGRIDRLERELRAAAIYEEFPAAVAAMMFSAHGQRRFVVDPRLTESQMTFAVTMCAFAAYTGRTYCLVDRADDE